MINPVIIEFLIKTIIIVGVTLASVDYMTQKHKTQYSKRWENCEPEDFDFGKYD